MKTAKITVKSANFKFEHLIDFTDKKELDSAMAKTKAFYAAKYNLAVLTFTKSILK